jgi:Phospholipase_D-nuclease N-terminal
VHRSSAKEVRAVIFGDGIVALGLLGLWIFCILDVISTDQVLCRNLPKYVWLFIVIILPGVGSVAWLLLGRPTGAGFRLGSQIGVYKPQKRAIGPEDSPDFIASMERKRLEGWEQELKRREDELRRREEKDGPE